MYTKKVFLYAIDKKNDRVVNYRFLEEPNISVGQIKAMARTMYLIGGDQVDVFAIDSYPNLCCDYMEAVRSNNHADWVAFKCLLDKHGMYIT